MKKQMILGVSLGVLSTAAAFSTARAADSSAAQQPAAKTVKLHIEKMACSACADRVKNVLTQMDGVSQAQVGLKEKGALVTYDPAKVTPDQLAKAVTEAGFKATVAEKQRG